MTPFGDTWISTTRTPAPWMAAVPSAQPAPTVDSWSWALRLLGHAPVADASAAAGPAAVTPAPAPALVADASRPVAVATPAPAERPSRPASAVAAAAPAPATTGPARRLAPTGNARRSAIPVAQAGATGTLRLARGQVTYRQVSVRAGARSRTIAIPPHATASGARVEVFAVQPWRSRAHVTQVLVPVTGSRVTIPAGAEVRFLVRVTGARAGRSAVDAGVARFVAHVAPRSIQPLPMLTWVNASSARSRGATTAAVEETLGTFGVASTRGGAGGARLPRQFLSAAWEAATRQPIGPVVARILETERELARANPGAQLWVQVADEQDTTAAKAVATTRWVARLRSELERQGSRTKLFAATQPRPHTRSYASVVDGWAVTQSSAGMTRAQSLAAVRDAAARTGRRIELMEYPGNAFLDARTPGGAALSTASAALDGAGAWFLYSANNLDVLESGRGVDARGDIGGLVAIRDGRVLPTLALAEAQYGASLGAAARVAGGDARSGSAARAVRAAAGALDGYRHGSAPRLAAWEQAIGAALR